jgi:hypothetical protein
MELTRKEFEIMARVAERGVALLATAGTAVKRLDLMMDLEFTHDVCPLDFAKLAAFGDGDFAHDIGGIYQHFNRRTRKLEGCFLPRCAKDIAYDDEANVEREQEAFRKANNCDASDTNMTDPEANR